MLFTTQSERSERIRSVLLLSNTSHPPAEYKRLARYWHKRYLRTHDQADLRRAKRFARLAKVGKS